MAARSDSGSLYLARKSYRQRRLRDIAKMLPIFGLVLWMLPLSANDTRSGITGLYLFGVWFGLICIAALLARLITPAPGEDDTVDDAQ